MSLPPWRARQVMGCEWALVECLQTSLSSSPQLHILSPSRLCVDCDLTCDLLGVPVTPVFWQLFIIALYIKFINLFTKEGANNYLVLTEQQERENCT